jgi:GNAT superfamily N-acetyltransferase
MTFGVWHAYWGFIGLVNLVMAEDIGFFHYWIARDFQGNGFGPHAVELLLHLAEQAWGLRTCYAKCFADNLPSRKALAKLGFAKLEVPICSPVPREEWHFVRPSRKDFDPSHLRDELAFLFSRMGSDSQVVPQIVLSSPAVSRNFAAFRYRPF